MMLRQSTDSILDKGVSAIQVLNRKRDRFTHLPADLPAGFVHPLKEAGEPLRRDIGRDALGIDSPPGDLERSQ